VECVAEVVFTTNMTGYQEVFTDPSYGDQIVVMTTPMIGNYGVNADDPESGKPQVAGVVVHPHHPDAWQGDRPGRAVADADRWRAALRALVAQPERLHDPALAFQPWESHSATRALTLAGGGERRQGAERGPLGS